jgi:membrane protease YdiL (CAAX protease family)
MIEKNKNFPNLMQGVLLMVALFGIEFVVDATMDGTGALAGLHPIDASGMIMVISNAILFTFLMHYKGMSYRELFHSAASPQRFDWAVILPAIALTVPALVAIVSWMVSLAVDAFPLSQDQQEMFSEMGSGSFGAIVISCLLAPVLEEMLFRGIILRSFLQLYSKWSAIVFSAVIFGVAHMNLYQFIVGIVLGSALGWLYQRSRSLIPCIALHMAYNTTLTMLDEFGVGGLGNGLLEQLVILAGFVFLAVRGVDMLRRTLPDPK